jgi:hypothetical protein
MVSFSSVSTSGGLVLVHFNRAQITEQKDSYSRGLVLGLTMAEIAILIIFILLLTLAALLDKEHEKLEEEHEKLEKVQQQVKALVEENLALEDINGGKDISEFIRELVSSREALRQAGVVHSRLAEAVELINKYEEAARKSGVEPTPRGVTEALLESKELKEALAEVSDKSVQEIAQENINLRTETSRMEGQLANAQKKLESFGKGNEMPSCWAKPDGTVEYIYEIAVNNNGMIARNTNLPHRDADRKLLPTMMVIHNQQVSSSKFISMSLPLYQWSVEKKCRFYVKVYDLTGSIDKDIYKERLQTVESLFYRDFKIHKNF